MKERHFQNHTHYTLVHDCKTRCETLQALEPMWHLCESVMLRICAEICGNVYFSPLQNS